MPELSRNHLFAIAIVVVLLLVALAIAGNGQAGSTKRAEVPANVDLIRMAEIEYASAFEEYVSAEAAPRDPLTVDSNPVPWTSSRGFDKLSWKPEQLEVYGSYAVNATRDGFTVYGVCDVDGDHVQARFQATLGEQAKMLTEDAVK